MNNKTIKRQIRHGVFETNSSSTHSLTMCSEEEYETWKKGDILFDDWCEEFVKPCEVKEGYDDRYMNYDRYWDTREMETFEQTYTTKNGERIIAFGEYGFNG